MTIPPNPWFLRFLDGGNARSSAIAAVAFAIGYMWGKENRWQEIARHYDRHWHHEGKHTEREHDRSNHREHSRDYER